jgi:hypothetical protein
MGDGFWTSAGIRFDAEGRARKSGPLGSANARPGCPHRNVAAAPRGQTPVAGGRMFRGGWTEPDVISFRASSTPSFHAPARWQSVSTTASGPWLL